MGRSLDRVWPLGLPSPRRGRFMVSFCRSVAWSTGLDLVGRRILREKALAAKMVPCKLDSHTSLLRASVCYSHPVTPDELGFGMSYADLDNSHFHLFTRKCSADEDEQSVETSQSSAIP